jgi:hypothetical protein
VSELKEEDELDESFELKFPQPSSLSTSPASLSLREESGDE